MKLKVFVLSAILAAAAIAALASMNLKMQKRIMELESKEPYVLVIHEPCQHLREESEAEMEEEVPQARETKPVPKETTDVDLLARLIMCEIGSDPHPDEQLYNVGSVVINRINDSRFPNSLRDVIYQPGQYGPAITGQIDRTQPTQRCYEIAQDLLANGSRLPADVVWQSGVTQGTEVYSSYKSPVTGTTTYYCR
ncbi:MAG: cell wall hydrolase [Eubacterium sp.]|nr:cell wall hydrolase [Eubacterium sp.]